MVTDAKTGSDIGQFAAAKGKRSTWEQAEGSPLPLGVTWIEGEQAFNFAVHAEHAESVTLLLYAATDLVDPLLAYGSTICGTNQVGFGIAASL